MTAGRAFPFLIFFPLLLAACSDSRGRAASALKRVKAQQLREDVARFSKNIFASQRETIVLVNQQFWSASMSELHPEKVTAYPDGFAFCLESKGDTESGLYVVPLGMELEPKQTQWASFERLSEGIFWYSFQP